MMLFCDRCGRLTMARVRRFSRGVASQSKVPLGLVIQAMALDIDQKDGGLEVVNFGAQVRRRESSSSFRAHLKICHCLFWWTKD